MTNCIEIHWTDHSRYVTRKNWFVWVDFQQPALKPYLYFIKPSFKQNWTRLWLIDHLISGEEAPDRHTACLPSGVSAREESADMEAPARGDSGPSSMMWTSSGRIGEAAMILGYTRAVLLILSQAPRANMEVLTYEGDSWTVKGPLVVNVWLVWCSANKSDTLNVLDDLMTSWCMHFNDISWVV